MRLFDDVERHDNGLKGAAEPDFAFLNRSARPRIAGTRELLQRWFDDVVAERNDKKDLWASLQARNEATHLGAFFGLYCHGWLRHQAYDVALHESADESTGRRPDFAVGRGGEGLFYLEATLAADTFMDAETSKRLGEFLEGLEKLESPNYGLWVKYDEGPEHAPSAKKALRFLKEKIGRLEATGGGGVAPSKEEGIEWEYDDRGWTVRFSPVLRPQRSARGQEGRRVVVKHLMSGFRAPEEPLNAKIRRKATRYGALDLPYVVAVNTMDDFTDDTDVLDALLGGISCRVYLGTGGRDRGAELYRDPARGAAFLDPSGEPTNTRVSAVLLAKGLRAGRLAVAETPELWHNPWAQKPLDPDLWEGPQVSIDLEGQRIERRPGIDYRERLRNELDYREP